MELAEDPLSSPLQRLRRQAADEDEFLLALALELLARGLGHEVVAMAPDMEGAVAAAEKHRPDLALMDLRLARGSSGIEAARRLHDEFGIRCVFVSGNLDAEHKAKLRPLEPAGFIDKPVYPADMERALQTAEASLAG